MSRHLKAQEPKEPHAIMSKKNLFLELPLGTVRPDVSAEINGTPVAIEVQISALSIETITRRTIDYHQKGFTSCGSCPGRQSWITTGMPLPCGRNGFTRAISAASTTGFATLK